MEAKPTSSHEMKIVIISFIADTPLEEYNIITIKLSNNIIFIFRFTGAQLNTSSDP